LAEFSRSPPFYPVLMAGKTTRFPEFRGDLEIIPREFEGGEPRYLIKDLASDEVFEFGEREYSLCRRMDGKTALPDILSDFQRQTGVTLHRRNIEAFERRLHALGLLKSSKGTRGLEDKRRGEKNLGNPDKILGLLDAGFGWCFSGPFRILWLLIILAGVSTALAHSRKLLFELNYVYTVHGAADILLFMVLGWLVVNPLGALAQGLACKHYGGQVSRFHVVMSFRVFPRFYFDISDALWFFEKKNRTRVFSSGLVFQLLLFSVCVLAWISAAEGGSLYNFLFTSILATGIFFLLNLLPFFERDGYLLLNNRLEIAELHNRAKSWVKAWFFLNPSPEPIYRRERVIFKRYGIPACLFEFALWCFLLWQMGSRLTGALQGVGACIFIVFLLLRFENPIRRFFMDVPWTRKTASSEKGGVKLRFLFRFTLCAIFVFLMFVPYPFEAGGDATLLPVREQGVRAQVSGEIEEVYVKEGQWVQEAQPLGRLSGRDQLKKIEQVQAAIDRANAKKKLYEGGAKPEEIATARQEVQAAATALQYSTSQAQRAERMFREKALSEKDYENFLRLKDSDNSRLELAKRNLELVQSGFRKEQVEEAEAEIRLLEVDLEHAKRDLEFTTLVSPVEGRIITPQLEEKKGQYLVEGELFAVVEDARTLIVEVQVPEEDAAEIKIGAPVKLRTWAFPNEVIKTRVNRIAPVAFDQSKGKIERSYSDREWLIEQEETIREKGRVVRVICELDNPPSSLKTGMTGYAKIKAGERPVGVAFTRWLMRFIFVEVWSWIP